MSEKAAVHLWPFEPFQVFAHGRTFEILEPSDMKKLARAIICCDEGHGFPDSITYRSLAKQCEKLGLAEPARIDAPAIAS